MSEEELIKAKVEGALERLRMKVEAGKEDLISGNIQKVVEEKSY